MGSMCLLPDRQPSLKTKIFACPKRKFSHTLPRPGRFRFSLHWLPQICLELDLPRGRSDRQNGNRGHPPSPSTISFQPPKGTSTNLPGARPPSREIGRRGRGGLPRSPFRFTQGLLARSARSAVAPLAAFSRLARLALLFAVVCPSGFLHLAASAKLPRNSDRLAPLAFIPIGSLRSPSLRYRSARCVEASIGSLRSPSLRYRSARAGWLAPLALAPLSLRSCTRPLGSAARCRLPSGLRPPGCLHLAAIAKLPRNSDRLAPLAFMPNGSLRSPSLRYRSARYPIGSLRSPSCRLARSARPRSAIAPLAMLVGASPRHRCPPSPPVPVARPPTSLWRE